MGSPIRSAPIEIIMEANDASLVSEALAARAEAESTESTASPSRWREADAYAELARRGWSTRRIADECMTSKDTVARFLKCACLPRETRSTFWEAYKAARSDKAHVGNNSGAVEWYTPELYIEAARRVMGGIDLDPCSCTAANKVVRADRFFSEADNGLAQEWSGRVWMNPPYAAGLNDKFCTKLRDSYVADQVTEAVVVVNNATETGWFQTLGRIANALCFPSGRISFWREAGASLSPLQGQAFMYLGETVAEFRAEFGQFGITVTP